MLVLGRKKEQAILIGDNIEVLVTGFHNQNGEMMVRLGITAPKEIPVHRKEVYELIQSKNRAMEGNAEGKS